MKLHYIYIATFLSSSFISGARADDELDQLLALDVAELTVSVASKAEESIYDAPSVVNVITAEEIKRYGARNLRDILDRQTHLQATNSTTFQNDVFMMRGNNFNHGSNHVLFLVNGRPFRDSNAGGFVFTLVNGLPVSAIDKIEIIRGPGSVLYGSGAYAGVINVMTKKGTEEGEASLEASYGSFDTRSVEGYAAQNVKGARMMAAVKSMSSEGWDYSAFDVMNNPKNFETDHFAQGGIVSAEYKNVSLNLFKGKNKYKSLNFPNILSASYFSMERTFADIGFNHKILSDDWKAQYNVTYNRFDWRGQQNSEDILAETNVSGRLTDSLGVMLGATAEHHNAGLTMPNRISTNWYTGYAQLDYAPLDWLKLVSGIQVNKPEGIDENYSPRFAAIANFTENWGVKAMYGEAFRSPYFNETDRIVPGRFVGNPDLSPETIKTTEGQVFYHENRFDAALTVFNSKTEDLIIVVPGAPATGANVGEVEFTGVELEGKARITDAIHVKGSVTWQTNEDQNGVDNTTLAPNWTAKAGVSYEKDGYRFGVFDSYFGEPTQLRELAPNTNANPDADAYHKVTLNAEADLREVTGRKNLPDLTVGLFVDNALDEDIRYPDFNTRQLSSVPNYSGRAVYATVKIRF